jgi:ABC-2 type transport system permease protein
MNALWSIRREVWENRSIYLVPLAATALVLFALSLSTIGLPRRMRTLPSLDPAQRHAAIVKTFSMAPAPVMLAALIVGFFYCIDALYGERRDRSILFWKSLPVSDTTTVLTKAAIPLVVLPVIGFVLGLIAQICILLLSTLVLRAAGMSAAPLWSEFRFFQEPLVMIYGLGVHALWYAPIYGWLLLISAWARRMPILWAILPPMAISAAERMIFNTTYFGELIKYRLIGAMHEAFAVNLTGKQHELLDRLGQLDPIRFLSAPGLWLGLVFAAAALAATIRLRHYREPI